MPHHIKYFIVFPIISMMILQGCRPRDKVESKGDTTTDVDHMVVNAPGAAGSQNMSDRIQSAMFIEKVALGVMFELRLGKLAFEKSNHQQLKLLAKLMEQDQNRIGGALKVLSAAQGLKLPTELPLKEQEQIRQMSEMDSAYFKKLYLKIIIEDQNKYIELFKGAYKSPDTAVSNFARLFLPVLETHREEALKVQERFK